MNRAGTDPKVKKTLLRNYERKIQPAKAPQVVRDVESYSQVPITGSTTLKDHALSEPVLCSSAALANYLSDIKASLPPPLSAEDVANVDQGELLSKMTKKLNFHFNDKIYRNLVELNASIEDVKTVKTKKPSNIVTSTKKDLEPDIEDFCQDEKEPDMPPKISVVKSKFRPIKTVENRELHKLVSSFEFL